MTDIEMTNEEAIKILKGAIKKPNTKDGYLGQALDMGIKALEQQPCEDCISRQAVINAIANTCFWLSADNWEELIKCINSISPINSSENPNKWIPVSERLPEQQDCYLVTTKWKGSYTGNVYIATNVAVYREKPKEWDCKDVIAWMPIPDYDDILEKEANNG